MLLCYLLILYLVQTFGLVEILPTPLRGSTDLCISQGHTSFVYCNRDLALPLLEFFVPTQKMSESEEGKDPVNSLHGPFSPWVEVFDFRSGPQDLMASCGLGVRKPQNPTRVAWFLQGMLGVV